MEKENLQKLEAEIRRRVPRLMELSFGCQVSFGNELHVLIADKGDGSYIEGTLNGKREVGGVNTHHGKICNDEIIGHPIDLEAVLEAAQIHKKKVCANYGVNSLWITDRTKPVRSHKDRFPTAYWTFGKSFADQSPELHEFLFELFNLSHNQESNGKSTTTF